MFQACAQSAPRQLTNLWRQSFESLILSHQFAALAPVRGFNMDGNDVAIGEGERILPTAIVTPPTDGRRDDGSGRWLIYAMTNGFSKPR